MNENFIFNCPSSIDLSLDSRSISFENTSGERGSGGVSLSGPDFVSFYRWHLPDPIIFQKKLKVTIQQIGFDSIAAGEEHKADELKKSGKIAGRGLSLSPNPSLYATGIFERVDDYCATAFVYLKKPQSVSPLNLDTVISEIERLPYEKADSFEIMLEVFQ
jgi:hypothetical protein